MIATLFSLFAINNLLLCAEAVLPTYIAKKYQSELDEQMVAIIIAYMFLHNHFSFTEVGCLLLSPVVGIMLEKFGRKKVSLFGFVILVEILKH
jgi:hypothetical protein